MTGKYKYLLKNIGLLTLSNLGTKLLSFLLVPLYTSILTTEEYGSFDFINTTVTLLIPIFTLDIIDSVVRFSLDEKEDKKEIFTVGFRLTLRSMAFVFAFLIINYFTNFMPVINQYMWCFVAYYAAYAFNQLMIYFVRGMDDVFDLAISSIINSIVMLSLNVLFLVVLEFGIIGYFAAYIIGQFVSAGYILIRLKAWKYVRWRTRNRGLQKEMVDYSKPLILNMVSWWVNNASDRYVVTWLCGLAANGLLAVGNKIPSILNIFQSIFTQAWQLSTVKAYDPEDKEGFFANIYTMYNFVMVEMCAILIVMDKFLARFLYAKDFYAAWQYVPFYLIAIVFGAVSSFSGGIFQAVKDSKAQSSTTLIGAASNVIMNFIFVLMCGPVGAALATALSYMIVWGMRLYKIRKYIVLRINLKRDIVAYILLYLEAALLLFFNESILLYICLIGIIFILSVMYGSVINTMLRKLKNMIR